MATETSARILLVEDEAIIALSEKVTLERHGYSVTTARSGREAIETARGDAQIDLVLMDIDLGSGMDGTEAAQAILSDREIPVVFLSSHTEPEVVDRTEKITSYGYIVKTSGETVLIASIKMAFRLFEARVNERLALRKVTHSHDLMRYILRHARSAIAVHDRNLNYLYVSDEYLRSYEIEQEEVIGRHHYEVFPDLPERWREVHQRSLRGEVLSADDDVYDRADGQRLWTRWECRPWYEDDGSIGGIIINTEVVNRTQRLYGTLVDNRRFLQAMLDTTFDGFCIVDGEGTILEVNAVYCEMTGYAPDELHGVPVWDLDAIDGEAEAGARIARMTASGGETFESRLRRKDGSEFAVTVAVSLLDVSPLTFICFFKPTG
jgi:PAS domain S-box-containing protein